MVKLSNNDPVLEDPQMNKQNNYILNGINIQIVIKTDKLNILNNLKKNSIVAILDGGLESIDKISFVPGDIVGSETIAKLSEVFKIKKKLLI